jgi:hypothetical protein
MAVAPPAAATEEGNREMTPATSSRFRSVNTNEWMLLIAAIQTVAVLATAGVAYLAWRTSVQSTEATAQAARATKQATAAAEASARAAETVTRIETERRHDELRPRVSVTFTQEPDRIPGRSNLFALLANNGDRDFRHKATIGWNTGISQHVGSGTLLAGKTERVHVTDLALNGPDTLEVVFEPDGWECSCGRGEEHWRLRRTIPYGEVAHDEEASQPDSEGKGS